MFSMKHERPRTAPRPPKAARPTLEGLEDRQLLSVTSGGRWQYGSHITYSFMPDGTSLGGTPVVMNQRMAAEGISTAAWQLAVQKAAAVWEAVAGIQLAQVFDNGAAVGIYGNQQGDSRFGDIRIGGFGQGNPNQLAFTFYPPPFNGGTAAGDIFFNTDQAWQVSGSNWDLETVAIHEFGHALGMSHSQVNTAAMYAYYVYTGQQLTADDIQGIQSVYGPVVADPNNDTYSTAVDISPYLSPQGQLTIGNLRLSAPISDVNWFRVTTPRVSNPSGQLNVTMQAAGLSSMCPLVAIYNQAGTQILAVAAAVNSYGQGIVNVTVPASVGQVFYIRCQGAQSAYDPGNVGAYGLKINFAATALPPVPVPVTVVAWQPDQGGGAGGLSANDGSGTTSTVVVPTFTPGAPSAQPGNRGGAANPIGSDGPAVLLDTPESLRIGTLAGLGDSLMIAPAVAPKAGPPAKVIPPKIGKAHPSGGPLHGHSRMLGHLVRSALHLAS